LVISLADSARFQAADEAPVVVASFACPMCLQTASALRLRLDEANGSSVRCRCDACETSWLVALNTGQALRLAIAPPAALTLAGG
jgi:hypothetical protein